MFGLPADCFAEGKLDTCFLKTLHISVQPVFYSFVLLLILLLKGFKNFLMLLPSTNDKNDSLTNGMQTFFLFYNQTIAKLMFIMHIKRVL